MKGIAGLVVAAVALLVPTIMVGAWVNSAGNRLAALAADENAADAVAVSAAADESYCTPTLKKILRRVLLSCGLLGSGEVRGCKPLEVKSVATMAGSDFNALFLPMADRAGIVQFDKESAELDETDKALLDKTFADQQGASYFFVVSRSSPEGAVAYNRDLSARRADAVMTYLREKFNDPDLDKEVGLLWLGEEFAPLDEEFCKWNRSGPADKCVSRELNRSAFVAWIDCRL